MSHSAIIRKFDAAAPRYDSAAEVQAIIAKKLVQSADERSGASATLDIGSGTGFVAEALYRRWPRAQITALDAAPAMLAAAKQKMPQLTTIAGDAATLDLPHAYDAAFSSMALHWLPDPRAALLRWRSWLKPEAKLYVALPVTGSFQEWRDLCRAHGMQDGLWSLPAADFADDLAEQCRIESITQTYPNARAFLRSIKSTGASAARAQHRPASVGKLRAALASSDVFHATYRVAFLELVHRPRHHAS